MPKPSLHVLAWSQEQQRYELSTHGHFCQSFHPDDRQKWQDWLSEHTSFSFRGQQGQMSVIKEARPRGASYWYAYCTHHRQTSKRYLGPTPRVTLERLEQEAEMLAAARAALPQRMRQAVSALTTDRPQYMASGAITYFGLGSMWPGAEVLSSAMVQWMVRLILESSPNDAMH